MLNKNGYGILYFGVKDNGDVVGQQMGDSPFREISRTIENFIKPQIIPTIEHKLIDDKNVIKIEVRGSEKALFCIRTVLYAFSRRIKWET